MRSRRLAAEAELMVRAKGQVPLTRVLSLAPEADARASLEDRTPLTRASVTTLALSAPAVHRVVLRPRAGELLARIAARDAGPAEAVEPIPSLVFCSFTPPPAAPVPGIEEPLSVHIAGGGAAPGLDGLGSLEIASRWSYEQFDSSGVRVQPTNVLATSFAYRRLLESGWLTLKLAGGLRALTAGGLSEWLGAEAFFMHPELRSIRAQLTLSGSTQPIEDARLWSGALGLMIEPVLTLTSGLHLVTKLGGRVSTLPSLDSPSDARLATVDPSVYTRYSALHPRSLFLEEGLEAAPFANVVLYANARLTTNPSLSPLDPDHLSATMLARALFGRTLAEASFRASWFFVDRERSEPGWYPTAALSFSHTLWMGSRHRFELGISGAYHFHTRAPELSVFVAWEGSNGRRFRDHTPMEGEDYFFPQRGPGVDAGRLEMGR